jgi:outer membrane scaffolding protein for murein synthesis (MipA/OmpV family)
MGEIKSDVDAVLAFTYMPLEGVQLGLSAAAPVNQASNGKNMHASVSWQLYGQDNNRLELGMTAGFADKKYGQTYYGVTDQQAAHSRFRPFVAGAGWYEAGVALTWDHKFNAQWGVTSMLGATHLLQAAARSPLTERKTSPTVAVYVSYNY